MLPLIVGLNCRSPLDVSMASSFDVFVSLQKFLVRSSSSTWSRALVDGVEFFVVVRFSSPAPPFPPGPSWISGRDPLLVVASCNSPEIHPNLNFRLLRCRASCLTCLRCLLHRNNNW